MVFGLLSSEFEGFDELKIAFDTLLSRERAYIEKRTFSPTSFRERTCRKFDLSNELSRLEKSDLSKNEIQEVRAYLIEFALQYPKISCEL